MLLPRNDFNYRLRCLAYDWMKLHQKTQLCRLKNELRNEMWILKQGKTLEEIIERITRR
jgi:hypothetical protein